MCHITTDVAEEPIIRLAYCLGVLHITNHVYNPAMYTVFVNGGWLVGWKVGWLVGRLVGWLIGRLGEEIG